MRKLKELLDDEKYIKTSLFVIITAVMLYAVYLILANLGAVLGTAGGIIGGLAATLSPLWIGLILAYLLSPLVDIVNRRVMKRLINVEHADPLKQAKREKQVRTLSILLTFLLILAVLGLVIYAFFVLIMGQLVFTSMDRMVGSIVMYFKEYEQMLSDIIRQLPNSGLELKLQEIIQTVTGWLSDNFNAGAVIDRVAGFGGSVLNVVLGVVVCIYVLIDRDFFLGLWRKTLHLLLPMEKNARLSENLHDVNIVIAKFLRGQLLDGLIVAVLSSVGLTLINLDFAVFIGCFAGICNIIPYFGPIMGMVPAAVVGLLAGNPMQAVLAVVVLFVIQQADSTLIAPRIVGDSIGLHPVFVLLAVTVGGAYFGIVGMLLAVPIAAILKLFIVRRISSIE
ncbi:AI-2E family transporter [Bacilliculturomica massiliensis]|uniref:AI-2E family transporter n=1 Tax=Bacilliculturomica massiliensis TaxID=1917867 RepID=UPI001031C791|nr:AI-2E family transporter [Bacilliculturomica massiliensis]